MIFPQTSHFDDLQKQKGKRLPCGVFPLGLSFLLIFPPEHIPRTETAGRFPPCPPSAAPAARPGRAPDRGKKRPRCRRPRCASHTPAHTGAEAGGIRSRRR